MVPQILHNLTNKLEYHIWKKYWPTSMNINSSDLLPLKPKHTYGPKFMIVEKLTKNHSMNIEMPPEGEYNDVEDCFGQTFCRSMSNVGNEIFDTNVLNLLKMEVATLKNQVMHIWNDMNDFPPTCDLPEMENEIRRAITESDLVDSKIKKALDTYDADKFALYDYAADYAGGQIIAIPGTTPYPTSKIIQLFGLFRLTYSSSPSEMIKPSMTPGNCFRFYGNTGRIILRLGKKIPVGSVSLEHSPLVEDYSDAPKNFKILGLRDSNAAEKVPLGSFIFKMRKHESSLQNFPITSSMFSENHFEYIELEILTNYGNPRYTSIYRFRVHAGKNEN